MWSQLLAATLAAVARAQPTAPPTLIPTPSQKPTRAPTADPTAKPTAKPTARPTAQPTTDPTAQPTTLTPTISPAPTASPAPTPSPTTPAPSITFAPTASAAPTPRPRRDRDPDYDLPEWAQAILSLLFILFFVVPCCCFFNHAIIHQRPLPDMGGIYTHAWYDVNRGRLFLFCVFATFANIFALYCASMGAAGDKNALLSFGLAIIQAEKSRGKRDGLFLGLNGYTYARGAKAQEYFEFGDNRPNEDVVNYDYEWQGACRDYGRATFGLLIPAALLKAVAFLCLYKRVYANTDVPPWRWLGAASEFACFCALLGSTIQFYTGCWRYLPNEGSKMHFPGPGLPNDAQKIRIVAPYVASLAIAVACVLSLLVAWIHFRMPSWLSDREDPEWFAGFR